MTNVALTVTSGAVRFEVHAKPGASKSQIRRVREDGSLEVAIAAPPVDGAANDELVRFLAKLLGVPRRSVEIIRGETARRKLVAASGITLEGVRDRLEANLADEA